MDYFEKFYNKTLRFLSYRPRTQKEISDFLTRKKSPPLVTKRIIAKLKDQHFLDDEEFIKWWIEQRTQFTPRSKRIIYLELKQKGISNEAIDMVINGQAQNINDETLALKLAKARINRFRNLTTQEKQKKLSGFLGRKGFDFDIIKKAISEVLKD